MKLLLISFFALLIMGLCSAQDGGMLFESKTIRPLAMQKWTGHVRNWFGYTNVDGEITLGKDVITQAIHRGYAAFDITAIPANAEITRISLMVYTTTASWSNEHTVFVKTLSVDPVLAQGETLYNSIGNGVAISDLNWKPMNSTGYQSTELNSTGVWNLQYFINQGWARWYIGFQENLDNDAWGNFRGWNSPGLPEPYCIIEYTVPLLINISPSSLSFGNVQVGQYSEKTFTISNQSNMNTISAYISINGSGFTMVGAGNYINLPVGSSATFSVKFSPASAGAFSGNIAITHNATNYSSPFNIPLTGTGTAPPAFQLSVSISNGWNMVSIPGLLPTNQSVTSWWPGKDPSSGVFKFAAGYQAVTDAVPGTGYWMKHIGDRTYNTGDEWPFDGILIAPHTPIASGAGWNLIGGYEQSAATANLTTTPPGLITGSVFKYAGSYSPATTLDPGYAYWVKLTGAGQINISGPTAGPVKAVTASTEGFGKIIITDNVQKSYTLYAAKEKADLTQFDLPPYPPEGMFDVRYSTQRYAENLSTPQGIEMSGVEYPVTIRAAGTGIIVSDETGRKIARLNTGEEVTIPSAQKLFVSGDVIPLVYGLEQNYPNPFNPSTTIQFSIPEDVQNVQLTIYSALGEKVAELVNTGLQAGIYNYKWDASSISSGMYIYQIVTEKFVSAKKMLLIR